MLVAAIIAVVFVALSALYIWWIRGSDDVAGQYAGFGKQFTEARTIEQREADATEALQ